MNLEITHKNHSNKLEHHFNMNSLKKNHENKENKHNPFTTHD